MRARAYCTHPSIRDHWELRCMSRCPDQRRDQEQTDLIYDLLQLHKQLELGMPEEALVDHNFVRLEPQVQDYVENGIYAVRRVPFGLSGAAPNFQKAIDLILKPGIGKFVNVYMDDVIISSPSFTHHVENLREVFRLLQDAGLTLIKEKCKFGYDELKYLGLIISKEGIKTDETKVRATVEMKPPRNSKEVSKFLEAQKAFDTVKAAITNAPVLKLPDFKKPFELFTDASLIGVEVVLNQEQRPMMFASRTLSSAERNYTVMERECLTL
ncbi:retrovirus-related Pol polyprotein from transposon 297 [Trichonephila clavipes]|nr:retrovirus-related Pol polyprotein from transposon 297 [Trichonephila clavipes]